MPKPQDDARMNQFLENCFTEVFAQLNGQEDRTISGQEQYKLFRNAVKKFTTDNVPEDMIIKMTLHLMGMLDKASEEYGVAEEGSEVGFAINVATGEAVQVPLDYARQMGGKHVREIPATGIPPVVQGVPPRMPEAEEDPMAMD
jgi:hypothetical protein